MYIKLFVVLHDFFKIRCIYIFLYILWMISRHRILRDFIGRLKTTIAKRIVDKLLTTKRFIHRNV